MGQKAEKLRCPSCSSSMLTLIGMEGYHDFWVCNACQRHFKKHTLWRGDEMSDKVVKMVHKDKIPREIPLNFYVGPTTIKPDITPYESALLTLFILRSSGHEVLYPKHLSAYPAGMLRHIEIIDA